MVCAGRDVALRCWTVPTNIVRSQRPKSIGQKQRQNNNKSRQEGGDRSNIDFKTILKRVIEVCLDLLYLLSHTGFQIEPCYLMPRGVKAIREPVWPSGKAVGW